MSNYETAGRKNFSDKIQEDLKPECQKPATEKISESITNGADRLVGEIQPDSEKGVLQRVSDNAHDSKQQGGYLESAKKEGAHLLNSAKVAVNHAAEYIAQQTAPADSTTTTTKPPTTGV